MPFGTSIGATAALHVAAHRPVAGLILQNPPPLREMILRRFGWWNLWLLAGPVALQIPKDLDSIANVRKRLVRAAIFLLAEKDEVVPPGYHKLVVDAYAGEKRVISLPSAHHNDPIEGTALADLNNGLELVADAKRVHLADCNDCDSTRISHAAFVARFSKPIPNKLGSSCRMRRIS